MKALKVTIDPARQLVSFEGPGTFEAKDIIRALGPARWFGDRRIWEVSPCSAGEQEIRTLFSGIYIELNLSTVGGAEISGLAEGAPQNIKDIPPNIAFGSAKEDGVGVSQFLNLARTALRSAFPLPVLIHGVIAQVKRLANGRVYLDLADHEHPDERVSAVIWQNEQQILEPLIKRGFELEKDLPVMFEVSVELSRRDGRVTVSIRRIIAEFTLAKLQGQRDATNRRLKDEGLFDKNRQLRLPLLPRRLGLITSAAGTVIHDFRSSLDEAKFGFELFWYHAAMQGIDAREQIINGINALSVIDGLDAILIFRGGGSAVELAVFNDYEIAKSVALARLPVISAIGHQEDQSSIQDVSYRALGVPKDVGRFFADLVLDLRRRFALSIERIAGLGSGLLAQTAKHFGLLVSSLHSGAQAAVHRRADLIEAVIRGLPLLGLGVIKDRGRQLAAVSAPIVSLAGRSCSDKARVLNISGERIIRGIRQIEDRLVYGCKLQLDRLAAAVPTVDLAAERLGGLERLIEQVGPEKQLQRGFTMVRRAGSSEIITAAGGLKAGDEIEIQFHDALRRARIGENDSK